MLAAALSLTLLHACVSFLLRFPSMLPNYAKGSQTKLQNFCFFVMFCYVECKTLFYIVKKIVI